MKKRRVALIASGMLGGWERRAKSVGIARAGGAIWRTAHSREATVVFLSLGHVTPCTRLSLLPSLVFLFLVSSSPRFLSLSIPLGPPPRHGSRNPQACQCCDRATTRCSYISLRQLRSSRLIRASRNRAPGLRMEEKGTVSLLLEEYIYMYIPYFFFFGFSSNNYSFIEVEYFLDRAWCESLNLFFGFNGI